MLKIGFSGIHIPNKEIISSLTPGLVDPGFE